MLCSQASLCSGLNSHPSRKRWVFTPLLQPCLTPPFLSLCFPPSWFYSLAPTPSFFHSPSSHRHPSFLCFAALLSSHFPSLPLFLPLLGADQFTVSLGGVRKAPAHPHPSTRSHPYPSNPEWITFQIIHPWIFFFFGLQGVGSSSDDDDADDTLFLLFFSFSCPPFSLHHVSSSLCKSVCDTISTPEIIVPVTNAAGRAGWERRWEGKTERGRELRRCVCVW